jgi:predicted nucleic acid-binding Zn ribbon protein
MPRYEFKCLTCLCQVEFERSIGDDKYPICCNQSMQKIWTAPNLIFNDSGFYLMDNRK